MDRGHGTIGSRSDENGIGVAAARNVSIHPVNGATWQTGVNGPRLELMLGGVRSEDAYSACGVVGSRAKRI